MGHITTQSMGKHDLGPFKASPGPQSGQQGSENYYLLSQKWPLGENSVDASKPRMVKHHQTPSLDMKQWYQACLPTFGPFRPLSGTPHKMGVF